MADEKRKKKQSAGAGSKDTKKTGAGSKNSREAGSRRKKRILGAAAAILVLCFCLGIVSLLAGDGSSQSRDDESRLRSWFQEQSRVRQLKRLDGEYPGLSDVAENIEDYPEEMIDLFLSNRETAEYLLGYWEEYGKQQGTDINSIDISSVDISGDLAGGGIPLFLQWDKRWGYETYGSGLIGWTGCGPTCLSMAAAGLTGNLSYHPAAVADMAERMAYYIPGTGTSWELMSTGASVFGLVSEQISCTEDLMKDALDEGKVLICSVGPGDFTSTGHFILIDGCGEEGFSVKDPNSRANSEKTWTYDRLVQQIKNIWALEAA